MNENYGNRGSYQGRNNGGNYVAQRGNYQNSRGGYNGENSAEQRENRGDKKFGAKFRIRGIVCTDKQTGGGFSRINTKNGTPMCSVSVMVSKYQRTNDRDRDGNPVWSENSEFFRLVAFGETAEQVMGMAKAKSIMEFIGEIRMQKAENGFSNPSFVIEKVDMIREYSGNGGNNNNNNGSAGYQRSNGQRQGGGYQNNNGDYNYNDRPNNYSQRSTARASQPSVDSENDYAEQAEHNDIPF